MTNIFHAEPVAIASAIRAIIVMAVAFGLKWTPEQIGATMLAVEAVLGLIIRHTVTSPQTLHDAGTSKREVVAEARLRNETIEAGAKR